MQKLFAIGEIIQSISPMAKLAFARAFLRLCHGTDLQQQAEEIVTATG